MENIFVVVFEDQGEAYQAFDEVKAHTDEKEYTVARVVLVQKTEGKVEVCEGCDATCRVTSTVLGGVVGIVIGALAGPVGVIVGGAAGSFISGKITSAHIEKAIMSIEQVSKGIQEGEHALIALVQENQEGEFEKQFEAYKATIHKRDAAQVAVDVECAMELQKKMDKWEKEHEFQEQVEVRRAEMQKEFQNIREGMKVVRDEMELRTR